MGTQNACIHCDTPIGERKQYNPKDLDENSYEATKAYEVEHGHLKKQKVEKETLHEELAREASASELRINNTTMKLDQINQENIISEAEKVAAAVDE